MSSESQNIATANQRMELISVAFKWRGNSFVTLSSLKAKAEVLLLLAGFAPECRQLLVVIPM